MIFGWIVLIYFAKDVVRQTAIVLDYFSRGDQPETPSELLFDREYLAPWVQLAYAKDFCDRFSGYHVFVTNYRWHPLCLEDHYSGAASVARLSDQAVIRLINTTYNDVISFSNSHDFVIVYR